MIKDTETQVVTRAAELPEATYKERSFQYERLAREKSIKMCIAHVRDAKQAFKGSVAMGIAGVNKMRAAGLEWIRAARKDQFDFVFFHAIEELIPANERKHLTREIVRAAIHTANGLPEPARTATDAARFMQPILTAFELQALSRRSIETAHERNEWAEFTSKASSFFSLVAKLESDRPMSEWEADYLDTFIRETQPVAQKHQEAVKLRGQMKNEE